MGTHSIIMIQVKPSSRYQHCMHLAGQASLLAKGHYLTSACTGVYTVEAGAAILEKTINQSGLVDGLDVNLQSDRCWDA